MKCEKLPFEAKMELRSLCRKKRDSYDEKKKKAASLRVKRLFLSLSSFRFSPYVLLYAPTQSELDITPIIDACFALHKTVLFPRCEKKPGQMTFRFVEKKEDLELGAFGVWEPSENAPIYSVKEHGHIPSVCLIPALAFDKSGYRLGYGKGYYDRFLGEYTGTSIGIAYEDLYFEELPRGYFDRKVDMVITETGVKMSK